MANKKVLTEGSDSADVITTDPKPVNPAESTYSIADFTKAAKKLFGHSTALVKTALDMAGKDRYTVEEAKQIVETFANKPVTN